MKLQTNLIIVEKIKNLRNELTELSSQIEKERQEASEENPSLQDLLDKKEILLAELARLENPDQDITGENSEQINKIYHVKLQGHTKKLKIVIPTDADPTEGFISSQSPLGQALRGKKVGDTVEVQTPLGLLYYTLLG